MSLFQRAEKRKKRLKLFIYGPPGSFKTRTALRLGSGNKKKHPQLAVVDTEFGTDHYVDEFSFLSSQTPDSDEILQAVEEIAGKPGSIKTLLIDTFSVYYEAIQEKWAETFLRREITSKGHKKEYYTFQPRDYVHINRDASRFVRLLIKCDLNIIVNAQVKDVWDKNMKIVGTAPDGWKRLAYYFDTVIEVMPPEKEGGINRAVCRKDRTHHLTEGKIYDWADDKTVCKWLIKTWGGNPCEDSEVVPYQEKPAPEEEIKETPPENPPEEIPPEVAEEEPKKPVARSKEDLLEEVKHLRKVLMIGKDDWLKMLDPYGVSSATSMSINQLMELILNLQEMEVEGPSSSQAA